MKKNIFFSFILVVIFSCTKSNDDKPVDRDSIFGKWQLVERLVCSDVVGEDSFWQTIENGVIVSYNNDFTFSSNNSGSCCSDSSNPCIYLIEINNNEEDSFLYHDFNCSGDFDSDYEKATFKFEGNYLLVTETTGIVMCPLKYKYIEE
jgi:hypothetical protein